MGKQVGAALCHQAGFSRMSHYIKEIGRAILQQTKILFAVGLLENAYDQTREIHVLPAEKIPETEPILLAKSKTFMPRLLTDRCDVLVVDWMGKNISGSGMDSNITGRSFIKHYDHFYATRVVTLNLTDESHGSMGGVGNADIINKRIFEKGDLLLTYPNSITHTGVQADAIPMMMDTSKALLRLPSGRKARQSVFLRARFAVGRHRVASYMPKPLQNHRDERDRNDRKQRGEEDSFCDIVPVPVQFIAQHDDIGGNRHSRDEDERTGKQSSFSSCQTGTKSVAGVRTSTCAVFGSEIH